MSDELWVEHNDYGPSKPQRKVGRHEKPIEPLDTGELPVARVTDNLDHDPRVTHGTGGGGDDILRLRMGEEAVAQATPVFQEMAARTTFQEKALLTANEELDNSLEVDPHQDDPIVREVDSALEYDDTLGNA
jgi:hypothetical protein